MPSTPVNLLMRLPPAARRIIRAYQSDAPVGIVGMAKALGVEAYTATFSVPLSVTLRRDRHRCGSSGYCIIAAQNDGETRRRFGAAHALGYFLLHRSALGKGVDADRLYRSRLGREADVEANAIAAELLMPYHLLNFLRSDEHGFPDAWAEALGVSEAALLARLDIPVVN